MHVTTSKTLILVMGILVSVSTFAQSTNEYWPSWRGPHNNGTAPSGNPPTTWSEKENIKWKVPISGTSLSSPVIWAHQIFYLTAMKGENPDTQAFNIVCLDRTTGATLWQKTATEAIPHEKHHRTASFASYSPVTDGKFVWASFGSRGLYCYDVNGERQWDKPLVKMTIRRAFGEGSSPVLAGDAVIVVCDHEGDSVIMAFNKTTGEALWRQPRDESSSWTSPVVVDVGGQLQVIVNGQNFIRCYDAKTGAVIWKCTGQTGGIVPTPVLGFGKVYCISGFRGSALQAITLGKTGDLSGTDAIAWQMSDGTPYVPSPVLLGDKLVFCASDRNQAVISCYNAKTGTALYSKQPLEGLDQIYASFVGVGDRIYVAGRNGAVAVIKNTESLNVIATNTLDDGFDASPVIVGDDLYLKGSKSFYCIAKP